MRLLTGRLAICPRREQRDAHLLCGNQQARRRTTDLGGPDNEVVAKAIRCERVPSLPIGERHVAAVTGRKQDLGIPVNNGFNADGRRELG